LTAHLQGSCSYNENHLGSPRQSDVLLSHDLKGIVPGCTQG
jgi:hypothetical protein